MKTVCFDFDGVIHSYTSGWKGATEIPDPPVPGIKESMQAFCNSKYRVVISSSRASTPEGIDAIKNYLSKYGMLEFVSDITNGKPPAMAYIDDRAICFDGHPETLLNKVQALKPWNKV